jgi:hypothetical protein
MVTFLFIASNSIAMNRINDPITEHGLLQAVEDSGYPFVTLTIEFTERNFTEHFSLNLEEVKTVDINTLNSWLNHRVEFDYESEIANVLLDLKYNGKSVLPKSNRPPVSGAKGINGILSNAEHETEGDMPSEIYIQTEEEITYKFPFFIDAEIVKLNGKKVFAYFQERTVNTAVAIKLVE